MSGELCEPYCFVSPATHSDPADKTSGVKAKPALLRAVSCGLSMAAGWEPPFSTHPSFSPALWPLYSMVSFLKKSIFILFIISVKGGVRVYMYVCSVEAMLVGGCAHVIIRMCQSLRTPHTVF